MNNNFGGVVGFVAGAVAGAFAGLLFAPDSGKNTRKKLSYQLSNSRDRLQEVIEELRTKKDNSVSTSAQKNAQLQEEAEKLLLEIEKLEAQVKNK